MAIKVNARETELKIGKNPGYYYVMTPELYLAINQKKVIREAALRSGVSQGVMQACWDAAGYSQALLRHSVSAQLCTPRVQRNSSTQCCKRGIRPHRHRGKQNPWEMSE